MSIVESGLGTLRLFQTPLVQCDVDFETQLSTGRAAYPVKAGKIMG
jgi:hypothetical protein